MTRVNVVPPEELSDQHLFAEFREIRHIPHSLLRSLASRSEEQILASIPSKYVLGTGHKTFFYDKLLFLEKRFYALRRELRCRKVNFNLDSKFYPHDFRVSIKFINDYEPDQDAIDANMGRILDRIALKPTWYRWTPHLREVSMGRSSDFQTQTSKPACQKT